MYKTIDENKFKHKIIAEQIAARETNMFFYRFNIENYLHIKNKSQDESVIAEMDKRISDEEKQLASETAVYDALLAQVTDSELFESELVKLRGKND